MRLRTFLLILVLAAFVPSAQSVEPITVAQLEQTLNTPNPLPKGFQNDGAPVAFLRDAMLARRLDSLQLSERLTSTTVKAILKEQAFGPETTRALTLLAYRSALFDPPAGEFPKLPPPTQQQQQ